MPSKSKAQFGMMGVLYNQGKISRSTLEDFNKGVHPGDLPMHVKSKKRSPIASAVAKREKMG